jgi:hypothetical protein
MKRTVAEADTFRSAVDDISRQDRKRTRETVKRIRQGYTGAGLNREKIRSSIYSYRVNDDIRIIAFEDETGTTLLYVDHHEDAYDWIKRRKVKESPSNAILLRKVETQTVEQVETEPASDSLATLVDTPKLLNAIRYSEGEDANATRALEIVLGRIIDRNESVIDKLTL